MAAVLSRSWFENILAFIDPAYVVTSLVLAKPHHDGYACACPAGDVNTPQRFALVKREEMFHEHPCTLCDGELSAAAIADVSSQMVRPHEAIVTATSAAAVKRWRQKLLFQRWRFQAEVKIGENLHLILRAVYGTGAVGLSCASTMSGGQVENARMAADIDDAKIQRRGLLVLCTKSGPDAQFPELDGKPIQL